MFDFGPPPWLFEGVLLTIVTVSCFGDRLWRLVMRIEPQPQSEARGSKIQKET